MPRLSRRYAVGKEGEKVVPERKAATGAAKPPAPTCAPAGRRGALVCGHDGRGFDGCSRVCADGLNTWRLDQRSNGFARLKRIRFF